jgi:hypothetical protein
MGIIKRSLPKSRGLSSNGTGNWVKEKLLCSLVIHEKFLSIDHRMLLSDLAIDWDSLCH